LVPQTACAALKIEDLTVHDARHSLAVRWREARRKYDRYYDFIEAQAFARRSGTQDNAMHCNIMRKPGLEPGRVSPLDPKSSASTNSATSACTARLNIS
jgi:hypothetical protein